MINVRRNIVSTIIALIMTFAIIVPTTSIKADAASYKQVNKTFYTLEARQSIKCLDAWGRDEIRMTRNPANNTIVYSTIYQREKNVARCRVFERGGTTLRKYNSKKWL